MDINVLDHEHILIYITKYKTVTTTIFLIGEIC